MTSHFVRTGAALLALASFGGAQAQTCPCNNGVGTLLNTPAAVQAVVANKMVCASASTVTGTDVWQEWHNGGANGVVVDYKQGGNVNDPSAPVGNYSIGADAGITYNYTGGPSYKYAMCQTGGTYAFCGMAGGRDVLGARVLANGGLQSCGLPITAPISNSSRGK